MTIEHPHPASGNVLPATHVSAPHTTQLGETALAAAESPVVLSLSKDLLRDFYQTFRLSQGNLRTQKDLFRMLCAEHQTREIGDEFEQSFQVAATRVHKLMPPKQHADYTEEARLQSDTGLFGMWSWYEDIVLKLHNSTADYSASNAANTMVASDLSYQGSPRPNRRACDDPHESIVREYVLGDGLEGKCSEQMLRVRDTLRSLLQMYVPNDDKDGLSSMSRLVTDWSRNHQGEDFFAYPKARGEMPVE